MGLFTRLSAEQARKEKRVKKKVVPLELVRALGIAGVRTMNAEAKTPNMEPSGPQDAPVYILGGFPRWKDDQAGEPFMGSDGGKLLDAIPSWGEDETRFDYCVRTMPPKKRGVIRNPTAAEIEGFRDEVEASILKTRPAVIIGLGPIPLKWMLGMADWKAFRGKRFPVKIKDHTCWFIPVMDPELLMRVEGSRYEKVPAEQWEVFWERDVAEAYRLADDLDTVPVVVSPEEAQEGIVHCMTVTEVEEAVEHLMESDAVGYDVECHRFRPYYADGVLLTIGLSDGVTSYAIPIAHPQSPWKGGEKKRVLRCIRKLFIRGGPIMVAHHHQFDFEWMLHYLGDEVYTGRFGCSLQASFTLDPGPPGKGAAGHRLNDLCLLLFGLSMKALSPAAKMVARLREVALDQVLRYNAIDSKWCLLAWRELMVRVEAEGMMECYERQMSRIPAVVNAQRMGVPVDQAKRLELRGQIQNTVDGLEAKIQNDPLVKEFKSKFGEFNPASPQHVGTLLWKLGGHREVRSGSGAYKTNAGILTGLKSKEKVIEPLLALRSASKMIGTYITRFDPDAADSFVFPDGRIHCKFTTAQARTGRLASEDPNNQNWPKRKNKEVRGQLVADPGYTLVAADQGQIEARVIAMESRDPAWVKSLIEGIDVHQAWAYKIAEISPSYCQLLEEKPKDARHKSKNGWVFPSFFGSSIKSIAANMELEDMEAAEDLFEQFWMEFAGVKKWQQAQQKKYERDGFVTSLTGRRRMGPLSYNMVINTPVQGTASDICVDAMERLHDRSREERIPWLAPLLQIHDDLTTMIPDSELEYGIAAVVEEQLAFQADWVNVPFTVEVETGKDLANMEPIGDWSSSDF